MKEELFNKRSFLINDYISQILVYGSNTSGSIGINKSQFDDGNYLILTVSVIKNSYFRWHDLGIKTTDSLEFYKVVLIINPEWIFEYSKNHYYAIIKKL